MKKTILFLALLVQLLCLNFGYAQSQSDKVAVEIINKSIDAMGGKKLIESIKTLYTDSKTEMQGRKVNWVVREMLPNKGSFQIFNKVVLSIKIGTMEKRATNSMMVKEN